MGSRWARPGVSRTAAAPPRVRVGVDVADAGQVADNVARYGERYTRRLFTPGELKDSAGAPVVQAQRLAARFAAKEAVLKILRPAADVPAWTEIEVVRGPQGEPHIAMTGQAAGLAEAGGLGGWDISISHEGTMAVAVVIAEADPGGL